MLRFLLLGLFVSVFILLPSIKADDTLTDLNLIEAIERALHRQPKDTEVGPTGDSECNTYDCEGSQTCNDCFDECEGKVRCASYCILRGLEDKDKPGRDDKQRRGWWWTRGINR